MSSLPNKNYRADLKYPGYAVMIAPTNCKDCDCAQRLVRCQKATALVTDTIALRGVSR
jgi:hypothetical protein